ncbi:hypothetical protein LX87_02333 [Larkinella arboricola]|uniref:UPF0235 protein LX87_02333 n=1 Tax=Larkinella arboricola TaxID=643671 RepID=A0A327WWB0_LARAB|nr:DUF167 domain-containing protein [Larkinella arboricola]RAJ97433.1 hypothetical protein LX87_02333 [Larkinella arboricola]
MVLYVKVKPGSKVDKLLYDASGQLNAKIRAPAQDGKANAYLVEYLARQFGIAKSSVEIISGFTNPHKKLEVTADEETVARVLVGLEGYR